MAINLSECIGVPLNTAVPEMSNLFNLVEAVPTRTHQEEISLDGSRQSRTLLTRVAAEFLDGEIIGYVVTFDDVTDLLSAQRKAAWADVARRIAHEIKNPLTPIQLSAERLQRKYQREITTNPDIFRACTDTIIRQVGDIGRMVDEFSSFARMPRPEMEDTNVVSVCREALVLPRSAHPEISFDIEIPDVPVWISGDPRQLSQVMTNLVQNAIDAIDGRRQTDEEVENFVGEISLNVSEFDGKAVVEVLDNGKGLPPEARDRLTEPYVTTRAKGTGLGLAIVKTILEDHGATLKLEDRQHGGARVEVKIPLIDRRISAPVSDVGAA